MEKITCPYCKSNKVIKRGKRPKQRYQCIDSKHPEGTRRYFYAENPVGEVWLFDIETLPGWKRFWRLGEEDWNPETIVFPWLTLAYSAKRLFDSEAISGVLTPKEATNRNDKRLVKEIRDIFDRADIIIAHNGDGFDLPRMNTRFAYHNLSVPTEVRSIDTLSVARKYFAFDSNTLYWLAKFFGYEPKLKTDYQLWVKCETGDPEALAYMAKYNVQDIFTLEDVYVRLRPFIRNHPNLTMYMDLEKGELACKFCGSKDLKFGYSYTTNASVFESFRCNNCGGYGRRNKRTSTSSVR